MNYFTTCNLTFLALRQRHSLGGIARRHDAHQRRRRRDDFALGSRGLAREVMALRFRNGLSHELLKTSFNSTSFLTPAESGIRA
jgi:hypothetical protein